MSTIHKINIGCGLDKKDGYLNADISPECNPDLVCNIIDGIPVEDNYFDEVVAYNVLTQIHDSQDFVKVMNELWRITSKHGNIFIRVPNALDICSWQDPMDCRRFTDQTFTYMQYGHRRYNQYGKHYGFKPFFVKLLENRVRLLFELRPIK